MKIQFINLITHFHWSSFRKCLLMAQIIASMLNIDMLFQESARMEMTIFQLLNQSSYNTSKHSVCLTLECFQISKQTTGHLSVSRLSVVPQCWLLESVGIQEFHPQFQTCSQFSVQCSYVLFLQPFSMLSWHHTTLCCGTYEASTSRLEGCYPRSLSKNLWH